MSTKVSIRKAVSEKIKTLTPHFVVEKSNDVFSKVTTHPLFSVSKSICIYLAMNNEIQTMPIVATAFQQSKRVFIPKVIGKNPQDMIILEISSIDQISSFPLSKWGIPEPPLDSFTLNDDMKEKGIIDLVFVPGVAFDSTCGRVGHGKGYYDTFLDRIFEANKSLNLPPPTTVGLGFDEQVLDYVPMDSHDKYNNIPMDPFPEPPWRTENTLAVQTLASTSFARFELHKVKTEDGTIVNDWMWTDERSHVNILVHLKDEDKYLLFYQKKYGLSKPYLAPIGGLFNTGETALECAHRELLEETGYMTDNMISLGSYRVQVNRGGGILYAYYAKNCIKAINNTRLSDDYEKQIIQKLSKKELIRRVLLGEIGEAQWVATVALGLLYEEYKKYLIRKEKEKYRDDKEGDKD